MKFRLQPGPSTMLAGYVVLSGMPAFVRLLGQQGFGAAPTTAVRFLLGVVFVAVAVIGFRNRLATKQPLVLILRGAFGGIAVLTYFMAVELTGSGMGTLLNYTHSIWSNVLAIVILRKRPDRKFWLLLALALAGLWLVIEPDFRHLERGKIYGLASGVFGGAAIICVKRLRTTDSALTIMASFTGVGSLFACIAMVFEPSSATHIATPEAVGYLVAIAVLSFTGQLLFTHGYRNTSVALSSLLSLLVPVIATLVGWLMLDEPLTVRDCVGAVLILSSCLFFGRSERRNNTSLLDPASA